MIRKQWIATVALTIGISPWSLNPTPTNLAADCGCQSHCHQSNCQGARGLLDTLDDFARKMTRDHAARPSILSAFKLSVDCRRCEPSCGAEPNCGAEPTCGIEPACGAELTCGVEPTCGMEAEPSCGVERSIASTQYAPQARPYTPSHSVIEPGTSASPRSAPSQIQQPSAPMHVQPHSAPYPLQRVQPLDRHEEVPAPRVEDSLNDPFRDDKAIKSPRGRASSSRSASMARRWITSDEVRTGDVELRSLSDVLMTSLSSPAAPSPYRRVAQPGAVLPAAAIGPASIGPNSDSVGTVSVEPLNQATRSRLDDPDADFRSSRNPLRNR